MKWPTITTEEKDVAGNTCTEHLGRTPTALSDLLLEGCHSEGLHHGLRRLRLHQHSLAEHLALACLGRGLRAGLDHAEAGEGELPRLLHLRSAHAGEAIQDLADLRLLLLALIGDRLCERALGHHRAGGLHR